MSGAPVERRRPRRRKGPTLATLLAWVVVAGLASLAQLAPKVEPEPPDEEETTPEGATRHAPVAVVGDWRHAPVGVVAARPPAPPKPKAEPKELPRPFAALRLASNPLLTPRLALPRVLHPRFPALKSLLTRARPGQPVQVRLSAYCLQGRTRRGTYVRPGIVAADPRVFPLARHVELYAAGRYLGRFRVEDTGSAIKGTRIDIWTPDCKDAIRFGMRDGVAQLVAVGD
ncbi:3D domain-containing protein [Roseisolibacter sp. H3M3-2]|uniref:3D domain-containing protein n=1 Tax=Roseisolibacter sp. H3M3-2 TaxID=3031323 RepID=UPI0023DC27C8|nr:3D domain-containing protein [Roseisolibacter sp. H3M3-2]MDF1503248.1 3D domain-containing protein [Roseisolibacter sp. H3M3-2]